MEGERLTERGEYANAYMPPERCLHGQERPGELRQLCDHRVSFSPRLHIAALLVFAPRLVICICHPSNVVFAWSVYSRSNARDLCAMRMSGWELTAPYL